MTFVKYETAESKKIELELGEKYVRLYDRTARLVSQDFLAPFDFRVYKKINKKETLSAFLEVKKKTGFFSSTEIIGITKWNFAKNCPHTCLFLVERENMARLFNITDIIKSGEGREQRIALRSDHSTGEVDIVRFSSDLGKAIYYIT